MINDYVALKLAKFREQEMLREAEIRRLIRESKAKNPSSGNRLVSRIGTLLISLGHNLKNK